MLANPLEAALEQEISIAGSESGLKNEGGRRNSTACCNMGEQDEGKGRNKDDGEKRSPA